MDVGTYEYGYDDEGHRLWRREKATDNVTEYGWDHRNRLTRVTLKDDQGQVSKVVEYTYDAFDRRIRRTVDIGGDGSIEQFGYNVHHDDAVHSDELHMEIADADGLAGATSSPTIAHRYLYGPAVDQILAVENGSQEVLWGLGDHQGTIRDLVNSAGGLEDHRPYDSFGNLGGTMASDFLFGYTGRPWDEDAGLYDYRARWYDPEVGRFLTEDPLSFDAGDMNLYRYVGNSPLNYTDPSGLGSLNAC